MKLPSDSIETFTDYNHIREWLMPILQERGISVESLANEIGVTRTAIYHYMTDQHRPTVDTMVNICRYLNLDPEVGLSKYTPRRGGRSNGRP